jgi:phospholipid/cholesterol/gamma-HCH transport system ATP-binding protein
MIARYRKQFGFTAVLISHDIPDIFYISDRILILWERKIDFQGTFEELSSIDHPMMHEFKDSIAELSDELTGALSREMLRSRYDVTSGALKEVGSI